MNSQILVGTLSTLNTLMAPLAGNHDPTAATYQLVQPAPVRACAGVTNLGLHIDSNLGNSVTVQVGGTVCTADEVKAAGRPGSRNVDFAVMLPADLLDEEFLRRLPTNAAYVIAGLPTAKGSLVKTRVKVTKKAPEADGIPLLIEWLPDERGHVEHLPMTLWMKRSFAGNVGLPWEKIRFSELSGELKEPLIVAGELPVDKSRASKLR